MEEVVAFFLLFFFFFSHTLSLSLSLLLMSPKVVLKCGKNSVFCCWCWNPLFVVESIVEQSSI